MLDNEPSPSPDTAPDSVLDRAPDSAPTAAPGSAAAPPAEATAAAAAEKPAKKAASAKGTKAGAAKKAATPAKKSGGKKAKKTAATPTDTGLHDASAETSARVAGPETTPATAGNNEPLAEPAPDGTAVPTATAKRTVKRASARKAPAVPVVLFHPPEPVVAPSQPAPAVVEAEPAPPVDDRSTTVASTEPEQGRQTASTAFADHAPVPGADTDQGTGTADAGTDPDADSADGEDEAGRRRRRRGGRRRRKPAGEGTTDTGDSTADTAATADTTDTDGADTTSRTGTAHVRAETRDTTSSGVDKPEPTSDDAGAEESTGARRRRRRRRAGEDGDADSAEPNTVVRVRKPRNAEDEITSVTGSTRLEAKKQRRREGREAGRRRAPVVTEAEFLARREAVDRVMVIRQKADLTQIAVLEDKVLVEHYVARESQTSLIGNVYLGRVQNVLPSMEAAFIDIGKGRNAVLYAGEVNWSALGAKDGGQRKIEQVLKSGQPILVQVSKDPIGHKGARLTSQISLPGRFLVYVPDGTTSGISRKLPDTERTRLKTLLKQIVPSSAGVIVRTAAEGASEKELTRDVEHLTARWEEISGRVAGGQAPQLLYREPDLTLKVVRDLFTEDFARLVVSGPEAWTMVEDYVEQVAPDLAERLEKFDTNGSSRDVFAEFRIDEQIAKGLDRKVWLPSGGSLVIDRTEAMTVVDVNTGKFTGSGGNLEETVTKNNLEAAEEIIRQLRLRDIGGIIVVDFIDMVLESNRDLVLRRMVECLGRDRTRHQVAEVTSLGLVQMTRKRIGTGLLEAFSESCDHCQGRGLVVQHEPVEPSKSRQDDEPVRRGGRGRSEPVAAPKPAIPTPKDIAAIAKPENADRPPADELPVHEPPVHKQPADGPPVDKQPTDEPASLDASAQVDGAASLDASAVADDSTAQGSAPAAFPAAQPPMSSSAPAAVDEEVPGVPPSLAPVVVSTPRPVSRRRRAATRPSGAAPVVARPQSAEDGASASPPSTSPANGAGTTPEVTSPPTITTSVRRRGAVSRPAGPPTTVAAAGESSVLGDQTADRPHGPSALDDPVEFHASRSQDESSGDGFPGAEAPVDGADALPPHVPVKKKGTRRH